MSDDDQLSDDPFLPSIDSSDVVFEGKVWNVRRETFELDDSRITREFVDHTGAVAILAMDDHGRILLIKQYRHPVRYRDWELPAGLLDVEGEDPLAAAKRELAEEADLVAQDWALLSDFMTSPGGSNEAVRVFLARGVSAADRVFERTDEEAGIELRWVDLELAVDAVLTRRVKNAIVMIAVLAAAAVRAGAEDALGPVDEPWAGHSRYRSTP